MNLAAYLHEASQDPQEACLILKNHGISHAALAQCWTKSIDELNDNACVMIRSSLNDADIKPILIVSTIGDTQSLNKVPEERIKRLFDLMSYFKAKYVGISLGIGQKIESQIEWMERLTEYAIRSSTIPLITITQNSILSPSTIATLLHERQKWKLLYDPAQFILTQKQDAFVRYWTLLKNNIPAINVCDVKIGKGYKPVGFGDTGLDKVIKDKVGFHGWYILKPMLGDRYGNTVGRANTFSVAYSAFEHLVEL